jgi:hypothetical protein
MSQFLIASNTSAVYIKTQATLGVFDDPTPAISPVPGSAPFYTGTNAVRVVGTPKFTPRGAGIIQRTDIYTPYGGGQSAVTGGIGWDITLQTEFFWRFDETPGAASQYITTNQSQLSALWLASPWAITLLNTSTDTLLTVQPNFTANNVRVASTGTEYVQPFSIAYEEANGKRYEAFDCICVPKINWESGGKIMIDWTIKGKWRDVTNSINAPDLVPVYPEQYTGTAKPQPPLIGQNAAMALTGFFGPDTNALSKVTVDTGWAINDVMDTRQAYGFGLGFIALTTYPTIAVEVANFAEGTATQAGPPVVPQVGQPDWTAAQANTIYAGQLGSGGVAVGSALTVTISIGTDTIVFTLNLPQLIEWPAPGDANGYRNIGLKFGGIPNNTQQTVMSILFNSVT